MKDKNNFTTKNLCKLVNKIIALEEFGKEAKLQYDSKPEKIQNLSNEEAKAQGQNQIKFTQDEKDLMMQHKDFFFQNKYFRIINFLDKNSKAIPENYTVRNEEEKTNEFMSLLTKLTNEEEFFNTQRIRYTSNDLIKLCGSLNNIIKLLSNHVIKDSKQPIHDLVIYFTLLSNYNWNQQEWFDLCVKEKKALKLLSRADDIEKHLKLEAEFLYLNSNIKIIGFYMYNFSDTYRKDKKEALKLIPNIINLYNMVNDADPQLRKNLKDNNIKEYQSKLMFCSEILRHHIDDIEKYLLDKKVTFQELKSRADNTKNNVPNNYETGMSILRIISYKKTKDIEKISNLSNLMTKERLYKYTDLCIENSVNEYYYNNGLDILMNPNLKTKDNLPDIVIKGSDLGKGFEKYYMAKLPVGDPRGLLLGQLTNCCQSIGGYGSKAAIDGMTNEDSGFYCIFETNKSNILDIESDRIIAQSYSWLGIDGAKGKSMVFDSWERLGKDNNKLLDPFYSRFADVASGLGITKITIGQGGNTPKPDNIVFLPDTNPTQFKGNKPYESDSESQFILLDINHDEAEQHITPYALNTNKRRNTLKLREYLKGDFTLDLEPVREIINEGANLDFRDLVGKTLLHHAITLGKIENTQFLIDKGADIDVLSRYNRTPLSIAAELGNEPIVRLLLDNGAKINSENQSINHLESAIKGGNENIVKLLIERNASLEKPEKLFSKHHIELACAKNELAIIKLLLENNAPCPPDILISYICPLYRKTDINIILLLINRVDINYKDSSNKSALYYAIDNANNEAANILIDNNANIDSIYSDKSALYYAVKKGNKDLVDYLINKAVNLSKQNLLIVALEEGRAELALYLVDKGLDINDTLDQITALHIVASKKSFNNKNKLIKLFLDKGAKLNEQDSIGKTALHRAIDIDNLEVAKLLIKRNAKLDIQDQLYNETPLHIAIMRRSIDIIDLLLDKNALMNIKDRNGKTAIELAADSGTITIVELIIQKRGKDLSKEDIEFILEHDNTKNDSYIIESIKKYVPKHIFNFEHDNSSFASKLTDSSKQNDQNYRGR